MNYWITTHWPPHITEQLRPPYVGVWIQDGKEHVADRMKPGDLVFKYESRSGPARKIAQADGRIMNEARFEGSKGIVALMEVTDHMKPQGGKVDYADGSQRWWRFHAPAKCRDHEGFVPLSVLNSILGYSPNYVMRGFGDYASGLKRIDEVTFKQIYDAFKQGTNA